MLPYLFQVDEWVFESTAYCSHSPKGSTFELFALVERRSVFEKADVVSGDSFYEMFGGRQLSESDSEVIGIVKSIEKILVCALISR